VSRVRLETLILVRLSEIVSFYPTPFSESISNWESSLNKHAKVCRERCYATRLTNFDGRSNENGLLWNFDGKGEG